MKNSQKMLIAAGAGLLMGGLMGILFAPGKGKDTRKKLSDQGKRFSGGLEDMLSGMKHGNKKRNREMVEDINGVYGETGAGI